MLVYQRENGRVGSRVSGDDDRPKASDGISEETYGLVTHDETYFLLEMIVRQHRS